MRCYIPFIQTAIIVNQNSAGTIYGYSFAKKLHCTLPHGNLCLTGITELVCHRIPKNTAQQKLDMEKVASRFKKMNPISFDLIAELVQKMSVKNGLLVMNQHLK